jgi:hypothetical protein
MCKADLQITCCSVDKMDIVVDVGNLAHLVNLQGILDLNRNAIDHGESGIREFFNGRRLLR